MLPELAKQVATLHPTTTFSRRARAGTPRRPSLRRSSRMRPVALARLFSAADFVLPWPFAPGISKEYAMYQAPSRSTIAVNSFRIAHTSISILRGETPFIDLANASESAAAVGRRLHAEVTRLRLQRTRPPSSAVEQAGHPASARRCEIQSLLESAAGLPPESRQLPRTPA